MHTVRLAILALLVLGSIGVHAYLVCLSKNAESLTPSEPVVNRSMLTTQTQPISNPTPTAELLIPDWANAFVGPDREWLFNISASDVRPGSLGLKEYIFCTLTFKDISSTPEQVKLVGIIQTKVNGSHRALRVSCLDNAGRSHDDWFSVPVKAWTEGSQAEFVLNVPRSIELSGLTVFAFDPADKERELYRMSFDPQRLWQGQPGLGDNLSNDQWR